MTEVPAELKQGDVNTLDLNSNFWVNNIVANQAYNRYDRMIPDIRKVQSSLENGFFKELPGNDTLLAGAVEAGDMEAYHNTANRLGAQAAKKATDSYRDLARYLFVKFMDGNQKKTDENGNFMKSEYGLPLYPTFPGYDKRYYENIVKENGDHFRVK